MAFLVYTLLICFLVQFGHSAKMVVQSGQNPSWLPLRTELLSFIVNATNDMHIYLASTPDLKNGFYYHILIGDIQSDENTLLLRHKEKVDENTDKFTLQGEPASYRLYFNHDKGTIQMFFGTAKLPFIDYKDDNYIRPTYVGISTPQNMYTTWIFNFEEGMGCCYNTTICRAE